MRISKAQLGAMCKVASKHISSNQLQCDNNQISNNQCDSNQINTSAAYVQNVTIPLSMLYLKIMLLITTGAGHDMYHC